MDSQSMSQMEKEKMGKDIIITRVFDAPRGTYLEAWIEPERVMRWWRPKDYTAPSAEKISRLEVSIFPA